MMSRSRYAQRTRKKMSLVPHGEPALELASGLRGAHQRLELGAHGVLGERLHVLVAHAEEQLPQAP
jgi:hypothetical protein